MRILIVDDESVFGELVKDRLELRGIEATLATNAEEALEVFNENGPWDLIFLDLGLPGEDGISVLKEIKKAVPEQAVVMLSGSQSMTKAVEAMRHGARNWLSKPVNLQQLIAECTKVQRAQELKRQNDRLADAARFEMLGRIVEGIAHEVNNPLNIIVQAAGLIEDSIEELSDFQEKEEVSEALDSIRKQGHRIKEITRKLLMIGHKMDVKEEPVDMVAVIGKVLLLLKNRIEASTIAVDADKVSEAKAFGSRVEIEQICLHLVENAVEAMPRGGLLCIEGKVHNGFYELSVQDTGVGIAKEIFPLIFDPFFTTKTSCPGQYVGLGLSVARSLAHGRGGDIIALQNSGGGARFVLSLPVVQ